MAHHLIPFTGMMGKVNPAWFGTVTSFSFESTQPLDIFNLWKDQFYGNSTTSVDSSGEELEKSSKTLEARSMGVIFEIPYKPEEVRKNLKGLVEGLENSVLSKQELFLIEIIRLNHLAYHILDPEFRKIAGSLTTCFKKICQRLKNRKEEEQETYMFRRHFQLLLFNYSLVKPEELRKNRYLLRYLLEEAIEDLRDSDFGGEVVNADHRGCSLLHSWRAIMNVACMKLVDRGTGCYSFSVFMRFYEKIMSRPFNIPEFIKNTVIPIMLKFYARRKNFQNEVDRRSFLIHPYIFLYGVIFYTASYDSIELKHLKHYCNNPEMLLSILQDFDYFSKALCSEELIRGFRPQKLGSHLTENDSKRGAETVSSGFTVLMKYTPVLESIVALLNWMTLNRVSADIILNNPKYVKFLAKKYVGIFESFYEGGEYIVKATERIMTFLISNLFNIFYYSPTNASKKIACEIVEPFLAKYFTADHFQRFGSELKRCFLKLASTSNYEFRCSTLGQSPPQITNHDSWWTDQNNTENGMTMVNNAREIIKLIFYGGNIVSTQNPEKPFKNKDDPNIILNAIGLSTLLFELMDSREKKNDFMMKKEKDGKSNKSMCLLEKMMICYWKGPSRVKQSVVKAIELKTRSDPIVLFKSIRDFLLLEGEKKWYCNIDRLVNSLILEEENCIVLEMKGRFNDMHTYFGAMKKNQVAFIFETDEEVEAMKKMMELSGGDEGVDFESRPRYGYGYTQQEDEDGLPHTNREKRKMEKKKVMTEGFAQVYNDCGYCHAHHARKLCSRCRLQKYCSTECQKKHWKSHKKTCKKK